MGTRVPASMRSRQQLSDLVEGRLSSADGRAELVKLATRLIVEEALEAEAGDAVGREYYEHGRPSGGGYRNGNRKGRLRTAEGLIEYAAPQVTGGAVSFHSEIRDHLKGRTAALEDLAVEMLARGLSVRDIEDAFKPNFCTFRRAGDRRPRKSWVFRARFASVVLNIRFLERI